MGKPKFSVVLIARNEVKTLPRLVQSLGEFQRRGGEIVLVDTGSKDGTPDMARKLGVRTFEVGDRFRITLTKPHADAINYTFIVGNEKALVSPGDSFFDFAAARNYAAALAENAMIAMPDCDEIYTALDIDKIDALIEAGASHLEYPFIFSHDAEGRPDVQFTHCKFYDRRRLDWVGCVHEVLRGQPGAEPECKRLDASIIKLEHWQNPEQVRGQYLTGLAWDCFMNPEKDRNSHYLARELVWTGRPRSAIKEFKRHIAMNGWAPERSQSWVFIGDAHAHLGEEAEAVRAYQEAVTVDATRREPLMKLAAHYFRKNQPNHTALYASAALTVDNHGYYMERAHYYREDTHMMLYWAFYYMKKMPEARKHWRAANRLAPTNSRVLNDAQFYVDLPKVSIIIPTLTRGTAKVEALIKARANYPNYEVIVMQDDIQNPKGVVQMVNAGVEKALSDYVMYLSDDCEPQQDFLIQAVLKILDTPDHLVALNDGLWNGKLATHWIVRKAERGWLPTNLFFHPSFRHHGCDNYLTAHFQKRGKYSYAPLSVVNHNHQNDECSALAYKHDAEDKATLKRLLEEGGLTDPV